MTHSMTKSLAVTATLISICLSLSISSAAQRKSKPAEKGELAQYVIVEVLHLNDEIVASTTAYRDHLLTVLQNQQLESERLNMEVGLQQRLLGQGLISQKEFDEHQQAMTMASYSAKITKRRIESAEKLIAETQAQTNSAMMQLESKGPGDRTGVAEPPSSAGASAKSNLFIRHDGKTPWSPADSGKIEHFFYARFGYRLPVSARGATDLHRRMNLDHRNAIDVALNPDSAEGQGLMNYLRDTDIPYLAFRGRVAGKSTGAHIHIGKPSLRLASQ